MVENEKIGRLVTAHFNSREEFGENYIIGRRFWAENSKQEEQLAAEAQTARNQLFSPTGAWKRIPWEWGKDTAQSD